MAKHLLGGRFLGTLPAHLACCACCAYHDLSSLPSCLPPLASLPADYAPPAFQARALQHTSVQLTWDADDDSRKRALTRRATADELKEDDFKVGGC